MLERNGLNYQPMTDRMTQCASELNHFWIVLLLKNTGGALQVKGFRYMLRFMYFEVDYLVCPCFKAKFQKSNKEI